MKKNSNERNKLLSTYALKIALIMKLSLFLIFVSIFQTFAFDLLSQKVTLKLSAEQTSIRQILDEIELQTDVRFLYRNETVENKSVKLDATNKTWFEILEQIKLASNVDYKILENNLVVLTPMSAKQPGKSISGTVTDEDGAPVVGASVVVKGTTTGTITDLSGQFSFVVPDNARTLVVSFVGLKTQEVEIGTTTIFNITLVPDVIGLEEVVAVGYGAARRKDLTSSITTITADNLNKSVSGNPILQLAGKVPGLNITKDGDPNGSVAIILRGPSTLRSGAAQQPFYVVDGIPGGIMPPPEDVVSIDILRDASATAIYGSRAANGVIIVTTKKGEAGQYKISYNAYAAFETIAKGIDMLSPQEYRNWISDMGLALDPVDDDGSNTVWIDEVTQTGISHSNNLSISGGNNRTTYVASVTYKTNQGIVLNTGNKGLTLRANVEQKMLNDRLKIGLSAHNAIGDSETVLTESGFSNLFNTVWKYLPTVGIYNDDGTYRENYGAATYNPYALIQQNMGKNRGKSFLGSGYAELNIMEGWDYYVNVSYRNGQSNGNTYMYQGSRLALSANGLATRSSYESEQKQLETYTSYNKVLGAHNVKLLLGYSWSEQVSGNGFQVNSSNFISDETLYYNLGMGQNYEGFVPDYGSTAIQTLRMISGYTRLNYDFKDRYLLQATIRRDGSSAFGVNNRWGTFPSVSVGWRILEESFMQNQQIFDNLKLRAGYGVSGNSLGFDPLISKLRFGPSGVILYDGKFIKGMLPTQNENPDLKWEVTKMLNVGLDFAVMKGRIRGTVEYYEKTTEDLLWSYAVPSTQYYVPSLLANVGTMDNKGIEFTFDVIPVQTKDFTWNSTLVLSHNKNVLTSLSNDVFNVDYVYTGSVGNHGQSGMNSQILQEGHPIGTFYTWKYMGPNPTAGPTYGYSQYLKADSVTLTTSPLSTDRHYAGDAQPKLTGGWHNTLTFKNLSLDFLFTFVTGNKVMNVTLSNMNYPGEATHYNQHRIVLESDVIDVNAPYTSTRYLEDGDYLRLDNITLSYDFKLSDPLIKGIRVYSTINNAFIMTKGYRGCDPEVYMGGITPGIDDDNYYPKTRSFIFGVNVDF